MAIEATKEASKRQNTDESFGDRSPVVEMGGCPVASMASSWLHVNSRMPVLDFMFL